ncbi:pheA operon leader peptide PheL [Citrobacter telavivensis]
MKLTPFSFAFFFTFP